MSWITSSEWITTMSGATILLIVLLVILLGTIPAYPYSRGWGYGPSGLLSLLVAVVLILLLMGRI